MYRVRVIDTGLLDMMNIYNTIADSGRCTSISVQTVSRGAPRFVTSAVHSVPVVPNRFRESHSGVYRWSLARKSHNGQVRAAVRLRRTIAIAFMTLCCTIYFYFIIFFYSHRFRF
jgi:hypothetical protein